MDPSDPEEPRAPGADASRAAIGKLLRLAATRALAPTSGGAHQADLLLAAVVAIVESHGPAAAPASAGSPDAASSAALASQLYELCAARPSGAELLSRLHALFAKEGISLAPERLRAIGATLEPPAIASVGGPDEAARRAAAHALGHLAPLRAPPAPRAPEDREVLAFAALCLAAAR